jgi:hypothetical protein
MKKYQSFGYGVNSVALAVILKDAPVKLFSDTGNESRETYQYKTYYEQTHKVVTLDEPVQGHVSLYDYCAAYETVPHRAFRWCTDKFKRQRLNNYYKDDGEVTVYLGIAYDEKHRAKLEKKGKVHYKYPLVENGVTRKQCIEIIEEAGLRVPPKSGCWFCPFQRKQSWLRLLRDHPDQYELAVQLEKNSPPDVDLYPHGLDWLRGRVDVELTQTSFIDEDWECGFCFIADKRR